MDHAHKHDLKPPITEGMTWRKCMTCACFIHETCGRKSCNCPNDRKV